MKIQMMFVQNAGVLGFGTPVLEQKYSHTYSYLMHSSKMQGERRGSEAVSIQSCYSYKLTETKMGKGPRPNQS